jgi:hypothetical protein
MQLQPRDDVPLTTTNFLNRLLAGYFTGSLKGVAGVGIMAHPDGKSVHLEAATDYWAPNMVLKSVVFTELSLLTANWKLKEQMVREQQAEILAERARREEAERKAASTILAADGSPMQPSVVG